jgi:hypothetical protein
MKRNNWMVVATLLFSLCCTRPLLAQQGPAAMLAGMDPQEIQKLIQERVMGFFRQRLAVTNDAEWTTIETPLTKVIQGRMEALVGGLNTLPLPFARNLGAGQNPNLDNIVRGLMGFQPLPEGEALRKAIGEHAATSQLKLLTARYNEARKRKKAELDRDQAELRRVLTLSQEANLLLIGVLD